MSHKVNPKIYRISNLADWDSRWLSRKNFAGNLEEDFKIREFFRKKFANFSIAKIEIERSPNFVKIIVNTARPGMLIGRGGEGIEKIKGYLLENILSKITNGRKNDLKLEVIEVKNPWLHAFLIARWVAEQIERKVPYKRTLKKALSRIMLRRDVQGARIEIAGRLGGSEIARRVWLKEGRLPRQTIKAEIDYAQARALCTYGTIGIKVWLYKGDK